MFTQKMFIQQIFTQKNFHTKLFRIKKFFTESVRLSFVDLRWAQLYVSLVDLLINILSGLQIGLIVKHQADFNRIRYGDVRNCGQLRKKMKSAGWALQSPISYENSDARVGKSFCDFAAKQMDLLLI